MRIRLLLAATLLAVAGCGDETDDGDTTGQEPSTSLDGRTFVATSITDLGKEHELVRGSELRISFDDGEVSLNAGCNQMGANYAIDNSLLVITGMSTTEMGCSQPLMDQDAWLAELFVNPVSFALEGDDELLITSEDVVIQLTDREVVSPDRPLEGTIWVLDSLITGDAVSSVPGDVVASLLIDDGTAHIDQGCNTATADVAIDGATMTFTNVTETDLACGGDRGRVEETIGDVLFHDTVTWTITETSLTVTGARDGLGFRVA